eukprot:1042700-Prymnesium_polylepis.1
MEMGSNAVVDVAPKLLLGLAPRVLDAHAGELGVALDTEAEDVAAGLDELRERRLLVRKVPAV